MKPVMAAIGLIVTLWFGASPAMAAEPLRIILLPFTNTVALMRLNAPLRAFLEERFGRPVALYTSNDFTTHFDEVRQGKFDLVITAAHIGAWAVQNGHHPVLRYSRRLYPVLAVRADSGIRRPEDMKHKVVILSNQLSVATMGGEFWLHDLGLEPGRDYTVRVSPTHSSALMSVVLGEADAAITTESPIHQSPEDIRQKLSFIRGPQPTLHLFTVANRALSAEQVDGLRQALLAFETTNSGRDFFRETGYQGYAPLTAGDVNSMAPYIALLLKLSARGGPS